MLLLILLEILKMHIQEVFLLLLFPLSKTLSSILNKVTQ